MWPCPVGFLFATTATIIVWRAHKRLRPRRLQAPSRAKLQPFAALNNADENDMTNYARQNNTQEDLIVQHQQQQQLLMMQGVSMALDNKGNSCNKSD